MDDNHSRKSYLSENKHKIIGIKNELNIYINNFVIYFIY